MVIFLVFILAVRMLSAQESGYFEGEGGRGIRVAVLLPGGQGLAPDEEWLLALIQGSMAADFNKYSSMTVVDRQNLETVLAEQDRSLSGGYSEDEYIKIGNLTNAQYILTGSLKKTGQGAFLLEMAITGAETGVRRASYAPKSCSLRDLQGLSVLKDAFEDLVSQMGVRLTEAGKQALRSGVGTAGAEEFADSVKTGLREDDRLMRWFLQNAETFYAMGEIREALRYYNNLARAFPQNYKGWLGIVRCYSGDFKDFDFNDCEVYLRRALNTAGTDAEKREVQAIFSRFESQWPQIQALREQRKAQEARRREENFQNMRFVSENGTLKAYTGSDEEVFIPDTVTVIGDAAFRQNGRVKRIVLHDKVTAIGRNAFARCTALTDIVIPSSVQSIGAGAFDDCRALTGIVIPPSVTVIPDNAFSGCRNLTDVIIGSGVVKIEKAFTGCEKLDAVLIPRNVAEIAEFAFSQCRSLKNITILNRDIKIGRRAFLACPLADKDDMIARFGPAIFN
ncbi:MAG: leucine-rich repeat protein [Spirochaetaceae bacterium]|jgi:tetratricopeptide (TPR) repeat protein|nr:leucine-rich repeat protein [Spirochaetaceae bacterium]